MVERRQPLVGVRPPTSTPAKPCRSPPASSGCARATTATARAIRPSGTASPTSRARCCIPRSGPRQVDLERQDGSSSSAQVPPPPPSSRPSPTRPSTSPCSSGHRPSSWPAPEHQRARRHAPRPRHPAGVDPRDRPPPDLQDDRADDERLDLGPRAGQKMVCSTSIRSQLPEDFDVEKHFTPSYRRVAAARRQSFPTATSSRPSARARSSVVTDTIDRVHRERHRGRLRRARSTPTWSSPPPASTSASWATSTLVVDGKVVDPAELVTYRGIMFSELPNLAYVFGYFRASWTLRADIISDFVCRLLAAHGGRPAPRRSCPTLRPEDDGHGRSSRGSTPRTSTPAT